MTQTDFERQLLTLALDLKMGPCLKCYHVTPRYLLESALSRGYITEQRFNQMVREVQT